MRAITYSEARENLKSVIGRVRQAPTMIVRRKGQQGAVLISESEWASIEETLYLLRSPANAKVLLKAVRGLEAGGGEEHELIEPRSSPSGRAPGSHMSSGRAMISARWVRSTR